MAPRKKSSKKAQTNLGDVIRVNNQGNHVAIAAGRNAKAGISSVTKVSEVDKWCEDMENHINAIKNLLPDDKTDLKDHVDKVANEISKGKKANSGRLERLLNSIGGMAPDIFDVTIATLANPLAGIGLVAKKIGDKAKLATM